MPKYAVFVSDPWKGFKGLVGVLKAWWHPKFDSLSRWNQTLKIIGPGHGFAVFAEALDCA